MNHSLLDQFDWDEDREDHIARHHVTIKEVLEVLANCPILGPTGEMMTKQRIPIPKFASIQEEAEWWDKTDLSQWITDEDLTVVSAGTYRLAEDRCPKCYGRRKVHGFNLHLADRRITLHRVKGYYCLQCKTTSPARSVEKVIPRIEKTAEKATA